MTIGDRILQVFYDAHDIVSNAVMRLTGDGVVTK